VLSLPEMRALLFILYGFAFCSALLLGFFVYQLLLIDQAPVAATTGGKPTGNSMSRSAGSDAPDANGLEDTFVRNGIRAGKAEAARIQDAERVGPSMGNPGDNDSGRRQEEVCSEQEFLECYRRLLGAPQMKLAAYRDKPFVEWRCFIEETSQSGLGWLFGYLPSSSTEELELMIIPSDRSLERRVWPMLLKRRAAGQAPAIEAKVRGRLTSIRSNASKASEIRIADAEVTFVETSDSFFAESSSPPPDVKEALAVLADFRSVSPTDPGGDFWLADQLRNAGFSRSTPVRWRCVLEETSESGAIYGKIGDPAGDIQLYVVPRDRLAANELMRSWTLPAEVVVEGLFSFYLQGVVYVNNAVITAVDHRDTATRARQIEGVALNPPAPRSSLAEANNGWDRSQDRTRDDPPWLAEFSKTTSLKYTESGFDGFHFGDTPDDVVEKIPTFEGLEPVWSETEQGFVRELLSDREFYFHEGRLRVIVKGCESGGDQTVREIARLFGKPRAGDVFAVSGRAAPDRTRIEREDIYYFFPKTIACVSEVLARSVSSSSYLGAEQYSIDSQHKVFVSIFDKHWLLPRICSYGEEVSDQLRWIRTHVRSRQVDVARLPDIAGTPRTFSPLGEHCWHKSKMAGDLSEAVYYGPEQKCSLVIEKFVHGFPADKYIPEAGSIIVRANFPLLAGDHPPVVHHGLLSPLLRRLHARLVAAEFNPVEGNTFKGKHSTTGHEYYHWDSEDGWSIEVGADYFVAKK
jgi:hypothetical protein